MSTGAQTALAFVLALLGPCLFLFLADPTPLLVEPKPDLDWLLGLVGIGAGLWSASRITQLPYLQQRRFGAIALWIMLPVWLGFGTAAAAERLQETLSFRNGGVSAEISVLARQKSSRSSRGNRTYEVEVISPYDGRMVSLPVDQTVFDRVVPNRGCLTILIEHSPNGAARFLSSFGWSAECPWAKGANSDRQVSASI